MFPLYDEGLTGSLLHEVSPDASMMVLSISSPTHPPRVTQSIGICISHSPSLPVGFPSLLGRGRVKEGQRTTARFSLVDHSAIQATLALLYSFFLPYPYALNNQTGAIL